MLTGSTSLYYIAKGLALFPNLYTILIAFKKNPKQQKPKTTSSFPVFYNDKSLALALMKNWCKWKKTEIPSISKQTLQILIQNLQISQSCLKTEMCEQLRNSAADHKCIIQFSPSRTEDIS